MNFRTSIRRQIASATAALAVSAIFVGAAVSTAGVPAVGPVPTHTVAA